MTEFTTKDMNKLNRAKELRIALVLKIYEAEKEIKELNKEIKKIDNQIQGLATRQRISWNIKKSDTSQEDQRGSIT